MADELRILDKLPEMYAGFLPELFERPMENEKHATCSQCAMCPPDGEAGVESDEFFEPSAKCCTYNPVLPAYAVGGLLQDARPETAEGRTRIHARIKSRIGVTPQGLHPPRKFSVLYARGQAGFGRAGAFRCPFLDAEEGLCTVWAYREAVCTTWFCKYNQGWDGFVFWAALKDYLREVQHSLIVHALGEIGLTPDIVLAAPPGLQLDARDLDDLPPSRREYDALWGAWVDREEELYRETYSIVTGLDRPAFAAIVGSVGAARLALLERRFEAMVDPTLPERLVRNPELRVDRGKDGSFLLTSYLGSDRTRLTSTVYGVLDHFDGRLTRVVLAALRVTRGLSLSESLLRALYQHRILVDASETAPQTL